MRALWADKAGTWLAVDFESWERDHALLLEYGWSLVKWDRAGNKISDTGHLIVQERMSFYNHVYVQGNREVSCHLSSGVAAINLRLSITNLEKANTSTSKRSGRASVA